MDCERLQNSVGAMTVGFSARAQRTHCVTKSLLNPYRDREGLGQRVMDVIVSVISGAHVERDMERMLGHA